MSNPNLSRKVATDTTAGEQSGSDVLTSAARNGNILINGDFDFWQRATSNNLGNSPTYTYTADRWKAAQGAGSGTYFVNRQALTGETSDFALRAGRNAGATETGVHVTQQVLESQISRQYRGKYLTFSVRIRKGVNYTATNTTIEIRTGTGTDQPDCRNFTGGAVAAQLVIPNSTLTSNFQTFTITTSAPIGASVNQLAVHIELNGFSGTSAGNDYIELSQAMLNEGQVAAPFITAGRNLAEEFALCQRYYEIVGIYSISDSSNAVIKSIWGKYKVEKRAIPTLTWSGTLNHINGGWTLSPPTVGASSTHSINSAINAAAGASGNAANGIILADAEL